MKTIYTVQRKITKWCGAVYWVDIDTTDNPEKYKKDNPGFEFKFIRRKNEIST